MAVLQGTGAEVSVGRGKEDNGERMGGGDISGHTQDGDVHPLLTFGDDWSDDHARLLRARATADPHGAEDTSQGTTGMCVGSASVASVSRCTATNRYIPPGSLLLSK